MMSVRNLFEDGSDRQSDDDLEATKRSKKKKAHQVKEQMDRREMLNMQFTSIRHMMDGSEFLDQDEPQEDNSDNRRNRRQNSINEEDDWDKHTVNFDPFNTSNHGPNNDEYESKKQQRTSEGFEKDVSFRDLLRRNQKGETSFRGLMKMEQEMFEGNHPSQQAKNHLTLMTMKESSFFKEGIDEQYKTIGDDSDFETILWGRNGKTPDLRFPEGTGETEDHLESRFAEVFSFKQQQLGS
jgi:hypothetical protein